jgi:2-polyprenyl-3-methyl-5-hydroxy-6-metoxy-1,4-benzoquinol methylase
LRRKIFSVAESRSRVVVAVRPEDPELPSIGGRSCVAHWRSVNAARQIVSYLPKTSVRPTFECLTTPELDGPLRRSPRGMNYTGSMSTIGDKYLLTGSGRSDHDRLRVISEIHDGRTRELLLLAGLAAGHRFVEFGCGLGYVSRWAASHGAHATGIDLNPEQVAVANDLAQAAKLETAQFRVGNIYQPELAPDSMDMSYSRWLLVHLNKPVAAMRSIYATLKPGGVMVCEECDVSQVYTEPNSAAYVDLREICLAGGRQRGVDYAHGRRAHTWAKEAGFEVVHVDAYHPHYLTGEHKGFWTWTMHNAGLGLVKEGSLSGERLEELVAEMREVDASPDTVVAHAWMHQLIARKPDRKA